MKAVGVLLIFGGLLHGIWCVVAGFPWVGAPGSAVAVAKVAVLYFQRRGAGVRSTTLTAASLGDGHVLATSRSTAPRPWVTLVSAQEKLIWDGRALSASAVEEIEVLDRSGQLQWHDGQSREVIRSALDAARYLPSPFTAKLLTKARSHVKQRRFAAAIGALWEVEPAAREGDREAARAIVELASTIREHADAKRGEECTEIIARASRVTTPTAPGAATTAATPAPAMPILWLQITGGVVGAISASSVAVDGAQERLDPVDHRPEPQRVEQPEGVLRAAELNVHRGTG